MILCLNQLKFHRMNSQKTNSGKPYEYYRGQSYSSQLIVAELDTGHSDTEMCPFGVLT